MHNIRSITLSSLSDTEMEQLRAGGNAVRHLSSYSFEICLFLLTVADFPFDLPYTDT